ncbi:efflux RND transporter permease subunit, partial [Desulfosarcina sp.]|nr:efflux RND transporter permease subunit [Desulfosarcina sp.]
MNICGSIAAFFIKNKKLSFLIMIAIILWGSISFIVMPKQYNPDIVAPAFAIDVDFPGATVNEVYQVVTKP